jgi:hypothetical protein
VTGRGTWRGAWLATAAVSAHRGDDRVAEARAGDLGRARHLAGEVVRDRLRADRLLDAGDDELRGLVPAHVLEHHDAREDHAPGVHLVEPRVLGRGAVRRLEDGEAVADVPARRHAEPADLCGRGVGQVVAVEVGRGDHRVLVGAQEQLLEHRVGDHVLHHRAVGHLRPRALVDHRAAERLLRDLVAPVAEGALGELHDVALVHERHRRPLVLDGVLDGHAHEALRAELAHRLDADRRVLAHRLAHLLARKPASFSASGVPARNSMPEYTSSVFSRKITMSSFCGSLTGAPTPSK